MRFNSTTDVAFRHICEGYLSKKRKREEPPIDEASAVTSSPSNSFSVSKASVTHVEQEIAVVKEEILLKERDPKVKQTKCTAKDCRRRGPEDCIHSMCFFCCYEACQQRKETSSSGSLEVCEAHLEQTKNREMEDRYIEEALLQLTHRQTRLSHSCEERFTAPGQTVVIWCLRDFLLSQKWSGDIIAQEQRLARQEELAKKREKLRQGLLSKI